ncbi:MAG: hypothetical protein GY711_03600 [bacterium]|nr:hypothetical protein [bacterium]
MPSLFRLPSLDSTGAVLGSFAPGFSPLDVVSAPDGTLWVASHLGEVVRHLTPDGNLLSEFVVGPDPYRLAIEWAGIGARYCSPGSATSTGQPARMTVTGSPVVAANDMTLGAEDLPPGEFGYFLVGTNQGQVQPPGSNGVLCLACGFQGCGGIGRFNRPGEIIQGPGGSLAIDLTVLPRTPNTSVQPGETWNFQCWFRDGGSSNFTDAVSVLFY